MTNFCLSRVWKSLWKLKPDLKTGVENNISVWSEIGSGLGEPGGTAPPCKNSQEYPPPATPPPSPREKVKAHASQRPKWPELIAISLTWSMPRSLPLSSGRDACPSQGITPLAVCRWYPFILHIHLGEAGNKVAIRQNNFAGAHFG